MKDDNVGYGLRLANHEGEDTKDLPAGNAYKIRHRVVINLFIKKE